MALHLSADREFQDYFVVPLVKQRCWLHLGRLPSVSIADQKALLLRAMRQDKLILQWTQLARKLSCCFTRLEIKQTVGASPERYPSRPPGYHTRSLRTFW